MLNEARETWFDQLYTPLLVLNSQLHIDDHNAAFERMLPEVIGHSLPRLRGLPLQRLSALAALLQPLLQRCQNEQRRCIGRALELSDEQLESGNTIIFDAVVSPLGSQMLVEFAGFDPWGQERAQQQRWQETQALQLMVQGLCHEIRNPLSGMRAAAQLLEQELLSAPQLADGHDYTRLIQQQVDRINQLIQDFSQQSQTPQWVLVNLHQLLDDVLALHGRQDDQTLKVQRDYDPSIPELRGEAGLLSQLVLNLVKNAAQAGATQLKVSTRVQHQYPLPQGGSATVAVVSVLDNGRGVPAQLRDILFLPMVSARPDGTGLGLAVAQQVAHRHGGLLQYEALAQGSAFHWVLPLRSAVPCTDVTSPPVGGDGQ